MSERDRADASHHRLYWHSRRGMLELEFLLIPFVEERLSALGDQARERYAELLSHEDWEIFDWIQGREVPPAHLAEVVSAIVEHNNRQR